jgi:hypothetical protein
VTWFCPALLQQPGYSEPPERIQKGFRVEEQAGSSPGKGYVDATFTLKTAQQTLRKHGQELWVFLLIWLKIMIQSTESCYERFSRFLTYQVTLSKCSKSYTPRMLRSTSELGRNLNSSSLTSEVKQGDKLAPLLFIFGIHAVSNSLGKKWEFETLDFLWYPDTQVEKRRGRYCTWNQSVQQGNNTFVLEVLLCGRCSLYLSQPWRNGHRFQAYRLTLTLSAFWTDYSHWSQEQKRRFENGGHSLSKTWTGIIGC